MIYTGAATPLNRVITQSHCVVIMLCLQQLTSVLTCLPFQKAVTKVKLNSIKKKNERKKKPVSKDARGDKYLEG